MKPNTESLRTSWSLIARLKNIDDDQSWREFFEIYRGFILGVAIKAGLHEDEAEEVLQETMLSVSKNINKFKAEPQFGSFHAWLLKLIRWRIQDLIRKRLPIQAGNSARSDATPTTPTVEHVPDKNQVDLEQLCDTEWRAQLQEQALEQLQKEIRAEHYQIFYLLISEQKPIATIAKMFGKSRARIYLIKHRSYRALHRIMQRLEKKLS